MDGNSVNGNSGGGTGSGTGSETEGTLLTALAVQPVGFLHHNLK